MPSPKGDAAWYFFLGGYFSPTLSALPIAVAVGAPPVGLQALRLLVLVVLPLDCDGAGCRRRRERRWGGKRRRRGSRTDGKVMHTRFSACLWWWTVAPARSRLSEQNWHRARRW